LNVEVPVTEQEIRERHFVDQFGVLFVRSGGSVTMGRILGHLLICDPPEQSLVQLADALGISKGSTSQLTRHLEQMGLILRTPGPQGARGTYFRMRSGAWVEILSEQIALTRLFLAVADQGLELLHDQPDARSARLQDLRGFYTVMERELARIVNRYSEDVRIKAAARDPQRR
jgi:DNA-binding transcriptional regulator GbsR (MarR family)